MPVNNIATIYHVLNERGVFRQNTANRDAQDSNGLPAYMGPVQFPMMLYHGTKMVVTSHGEEVVRPGIGVIKVNYREEPDTKVVNNQRELELALEAGFKKHPSMTNGSAGDLDLMPDAMKLELAKQSVDAGLAALAEKFDIPLEELQAAMAASDRLGVLEAVG